MFEAVLVAWVVLSIPASLLLGPALASMVSPAEAPVAARVAAEPGAGEPWGPRE
jgi:hypothetical protein